METTNNPFATLDDIDWQAAFTESLRTIVADEQNSDTLRARLETFMQDAHAMAEMQTFQALAATMGDLCCANPLVQLAVEGSESLRTLTGTCDSECDDEEEEDDDENPKYKKKPNCTP